MPIKVIVTSQEIWKARATHWEEHYQRRGHGRTQPDDVCKRVLDACSMLPEPSLNMFGSLDDWNYTAARVISHERVQLSVNLAKVPFDLLVKWYWDETHWQTFVNQFNSLPVPSYPQYEMVYKGGYIKGYTELVPLSIPLASARNHKKNPALLNPNIHTELREK